MSARPSRREQKAATTQRLFAVAVNLFLSRGYEATTIEAITAEAGVAKGTFFNHFPSKEAVLSHLSQMQIARTREAIATHPDFAALPARDQLHLLFHTLAAGVEHQRDLVRRVAAEVLRQEVLLAAEEEGFAAFEQLLLPLVQAGQARGDLRSDQPPALIASLVRGVYFTALFAWLLQDDGDFAGFAGRYLDLALDGLAANAAPRRA